MTDSDDPHPIAERIARSVTRAPEEGSSSRRGFLARSALAGGALLALGGGTGAALAQEGDDDDDGMTADEMTAAFDDVDGTDIDVLNYALTLEHLEDAFYQEGMDMFDESDFVDAESLSSYSEEYRREVYAYVQSIGEHEAAHVDVLTQAVELLGGEPEQAATYDFGVESVDDFLALGAVLENTGVAAYAGAAPFVESPDLLGAALSIHSVEARHAAVLNEVTGEPPAPDAFDAAASQADVLEAVGPFIASDTGAETETDDGTDDGTETPTDDGTATPTDHGTDTPTDNGTATPTDHGTATATDDGEGTDTGTATDS
ncbi:ferritin-like domain-containing protein [Halosimplex salinum]|uniref:ferritin-like domain-containing protein n=1 Tax=Halosimplex salinum TaxID=1710538 RepID=UPI000F4AD8E2|nr:ferritin-like domain-containing protein [Halosimplex salinum]